MYAVQVEADRKALADLVKTARKAKGMTQEQLDEAAGMSAGYTAQIESYRVARPTPPTLRRLAAALDVPLESFGVATGQLDARELDVEELLEQIDAQPTEAAAIALFDQLPPRARRAIRRLAVAFLNATTEGLTEQDGPPQGQTK